MPGSVANAAPTLVMPRLIAKQFSEAREVPLRSNEYRDGTSQRVRQADTSRRRFTATGRWDAATVAAFQSFWASVRHAAFYFYHPTEAPAYDATGAATAGRYTVRFEGGITVNSGISRSDVQLGLVEVA